MICVLEDLLDLCWSDRAHHTRQRKALSGCDLVWWDTEFSLDQWGEKILHVPLCVCTAKAKQYKQSSGYPELPNFMLASG